ncbi:MAG: hypothetical protein WED33_03800 [Bacteroidia bacterium]
MKQRKPNIPEKYLMELRNDASHIAYLHRLNLESKKTLNESQKQQLLEISEKLSELKEFLDAEEE